MHDLYTLYMVSTTPDGKGGDKSCPIRRSVLWGDHPYTSHYRELPLELTLDIFEY